MTIKEYKQEHTNKQNISTNYRKVSVKKTKAYNCKTKQSIKKTTMKYKNEIIIIKIKMYRKKIFPEYKVSKMNLKNKRKYKNTSQLEITGSSALSGKL